MRYFAIFVLIFGLLTSNAEAVSGDFRAWEEAKKNEMTVNMLKDFSSDPFLKKYKYSRAEIIDALKNLQFKLTIRGPRLSLEERKKKYREIFLYEDAYRQGVEYLDFFNETLEKAEAEFGVPREIITSIIWIESKFEYNIGRHNALEKLYNRYIHNLIKYSGRRPRLTREKRLQIAYFLALCKQKSLNPQEVQGSRAGALGIPQFMPYSYEKDGVDGDGDGDVDLFTNHTDAIFSIANYLSKRGWSKNQRRAVLKYNYDSAYVYTVFEYAKIIFNLKRKEAK